MLPAGAGEDARATAGQETGGTFLAAAFWRLLFGG
jgi:hypothetical protein